LPGAFAESEEASTKDNIAADIPSTFLISVSGMTLSSVKTVDERESFLRRILRVISDLLRNVEPMLDFD
jgi:hypothetical protein